MENTLSTTWVSLYEAAKAVQRPRHVSSYIEAGGVAAAVESASGRIYTGVCVDTACTLGICAERNAILNMITSGGYGDEAVTGKLRSASPLPHRFLSGNQVPEQRRPETVRGVPR